MQHIQMKRGKKGLQHSCLTFSNHFIFHTVHVFFLKKVNDKEEKWCKLIHPIIEKEEHRTQSLEMQKRPAFSVAPSPANLFYNYILVPIRIRILCCNTQNHYVNSVLLVYKQYSAMVAVLLQQENIVTKTLQLLI